MDENHGYRGWPKILEQILGLGLPATDRSPAALAMDNDIINVSNEKQYKSIVETSDQVFGFPPPCTQFGQNAISIQQAPESETAVDILMAYISDTILVVGRYNDGHGVGESDLGTSRKWPYFTLIDGSGWHKYSSLSLCPSTDGKFWPVPNGALVSAGNGIIQLWNIQDKTTIQFHGEHRGSANTLVQWSPYDLNQVFAMDPTGLLTHWKLKENSVIKFHFEFYGLTCMDVDSAEGDRIVVGNAIGDIGIISTSGTGSIKILDKSTGSFSSLRFQLEGDVVFEPNMRLLKKPFFVSCASMEGKERVKLFDYTGNGGRYVCTMGSLNTEAKENLTDAPIPNRNIPIAWIRSGDSDGTRTLLVVNPHGELLKLKSEDKFETIHSLHKDHEDEVGAMVVSGNIVWTFTLDSCILGWDLLSEQATYIIPTYHGVSAMDVSKGGLSLIALGCIDGRVRVVETAACPNYPEIPNNYSQNPTRVAKMIPIVTPPLGGKVYSVAWHPVKDRLAVGTDNGRLAIVHGKEVRRFTSRVHGPVYTLSWGPHCYTEQRVEGDADFGNPLKFWLYVCGGKQVMMINPNAINNALVPVGKLIIDKTNENKFGPNRGATDIQWSPDYKYLAIGYGVGRVEMYSTPHLKLICFICCHGGYIQGMAFRPRDFVNPPSHPRLCWFASASVDGTAQLHDLRVLYDEDVLSRGERNDIFESTQEINVHDGVRVLAVAWSCHNEDLILTCSYDQTAVVWDIKKNMPIARYAGHEHRLSKGAFHPTDPYKVITCADEVAVDCPMHIWDYRDYPYKEKEYPEQDFGENVKACRAIAVPPAKTAMLGMDKDMQPQIHAPTGRIPMKTCENYEAAPATVQTRT